MPGLAHLYIGEEAVAVGVCEALRQRRLHHQHPPRPRPLPGQGRSDRPDVRRTAGQRGRLLPGQRRLDAHRRPGNGQPGRQRHRRRQRRHRHRRGVSAKMRGTDQVAVCFFGEGALGQGVLYEVMNMASLWKLPVIYVCENNQYNEYTHITPKRRPGDVTARAAGVSAFHTEDDRWPGCARGLRAAATLVERARARRGAGFLLCNTYRLSRPPCRRHQSRLLPLQRGRAAVEDRARSAEDLGAVADRRADGRRADSRRDRAAKCRPKSTRGVEFALERAVPGASEVEQACLRLALAGSRRSRITRARCAKSRSAQAIREALAEEMRRDPRVFIMGEDVAEAGTPFKVLSGLVDEFGPSA